MTSATPLLATPLTCPELIGRAEEAAWLRTLVVRPARERVRVALISGEAGIGKSRLVRESVAHARERGGLVLQGACHAQDMACPYAPLTDLLRARFTHWSPDEMDATAAVYLDALAPLLPELAARTAASPREGSVAVAARPEAYAPRSPAGDARDSEQQRRFLFQAIAHCLSTDGADCPTVLVVEDLHWCDDASLDALLFLARHTDARSPLIIGTYRREDAGPGLRAWLAQLERERLAVDVTVAPLDRDGVAGMLAAIFGRAHPVPGGLADALHDLAEGNPFVVEELLHTLVAAGDIQRVDGAWRWCTRPEMAWRLPASLTDAVLGRVATVAPDARELLTLAAVLGRGFDFTVLQRVAETDERTLLAQLKELIAAGLVVEESRDRFAFRHALTREVVHGRLLARERIALHRTIAEALEHESTGNPDPHVDDLAHHFYEAEAWEKALVYARLAGERARRLHAPRAAITHLTRAIDAAKRRVSPCRHDQREDESWESSPERHGALRGSGPGTPARSEPAGGDGRAATLAHLYRERGRAYETVGELDQALGDLEEAVSLATTAGEHATAWRGLLSLGALWTVRDFAKAGACYHQALSLARALDQPDLIAQSLNRVGTWLASTSDDPWSALPLHEEALSIFERLDDRHGVAATLHLLGSARYQGADLPGSIPCFARAVELRRELGDRRGMVASLAMLSTRGGATEVNPITAETNDFAAGLADAELALRLTREIGWRPFEAFALVMLAVMLAERGVYGRAHEVAQSSLSLAQNIAHDQWIAGAQCTLGTLYAEMHILPDACRHLEESLALARSIGSTTWVELSTNLLARACIGLGDFARAEALLGAARDDAPLRSLGQRRMAHTRALLALARGEPERALRLLDRLREPPAPGVTVYESPHLALTRAEALAAFGRLDEAEAALQRVQEMARAEQLQPLLWRAHQGMGNLLRDGGRGDAARLQFQAARTVIEELACGIADPELRDAYLRGATALLPRHYRLSAGRVAAARHGGLTSRERDVAELIASGRSNRAIAEALVLSERTVEAYVSNILARTGATSRHEIAAWVHAQEFGDGPHPALRATLSHRRARD